MCALYSMTKTRRAIRDLFSVNFDRTGNQPPQPAIYPDQPAPIVRNSAEGREIIMARWGMPTPPMYLKGRNADSGVPNIRNLNSAHWKRWFGVESRCLVTITSFSENDKSVPNVITPVWFALDETRPLACFSGLWTHWKSVRKVKEGETENDIFAFLMTDPNTEVRAIHPKAMPVILTAPEDIEMWMCAPWAIAKELQRPLPDGSLKIVARGAKKDGEEVSV